jgi:hypothetical protein
LFVRKLFSQVLGNRQRVPDRQISIDQRRHLADRADGANDFFKVRVRGKRVKARHDFFKFNAGLCEQNPGPHGPGRVVFVTDVELEHGGS